MFYQVLDFIPDAVIEVDAGGRIIFANSSVEEVFGYQSSELLNSPVEILIPKELEALHTGKRSAYSRNPSKREMGSSVQFAGLRKDGTRFAADVALNPVQSANAANHTFAFVRDVTHLRRLEIAERELLDKTLLGVVTTLNSLMSLTSPLIFDRTQSIRGLVSHMTKGLGEPDVWQYELAAALCLVGCTTVPPDIFEKAWSGLPLSKEEDQIFQSHPSIAEKLLAPIPRLGRVAEIVGKQQTGTTEGEPVGFGVGLLQLAQHADRLLYRHTPLVVMMQRLRLRRPQYLDEFLDGLASYVPPQAVFETRVLLVRELQPGMALEQDLKTDKGLLIAPKETMITPILLERIMNFAHAGGIHEGIRVRCPA